MDPTLIAGAVLIAAVIIGTFLKPNADQMRPISPEPGAAPSADAGHHH